MVLWILLVIIALWFLIYPGTDYYNRWLAGWVVKEGCLADQVISLTFDDGPDECYTPQVLDILDKFRVPAAFFLVGDRAEKNPELVSRILKAGHTIGLHTQEHHHAYLMGFRSSVLSLKQGKETIERITGQALHWFRPPWGALNIFQSFWAKRLKLKIVLWSANAQDWDIKTGVNGIVNRLQQRVRRNSIIVIHDAGGDPGAPANMIRALPQIIDYLQKQGFRFVTLNEISREEL